MYVCVCVCIVLCYIDSMCVGVESVSGSLDLEQAVSRAKDCVGVDIRE